MHQGSTDRTSTMVHGYAWHIYPDPATPGVFEGDVPFAVGDAPGPGRPPYDPQGAGVVEFWQVSKNAPGIHNDHRNGNTYLAISEKHEPPPVAGGWFVAPAKLDASFQLDQRGSRWVHLVRIVDTAPSEAGDVLRCEFQIDRD
jgi:hypothetical protein